MAEPDLGPDAQTLCEQIAGIGFQAGVEEGRWLVLSHAFPELIVRVVGRDFSGAVAAPMTFRLLCERFPEQAPFVEAWDVERGERPPSPALGPPPEGPPGVIDALKIWPRDGSQGIYGGVYRPWQRYAAVHNAWGAKRPDLAWRRDRDITFIMEKLYGLASEQAAWLALRAAA